MDTTKNYGLKQWDGGDRILRTDFNENNLSIEAALDAKQEMLDTLEARATAHDATLSAHDGRLDAHDTTLTSHTSTISSHTSTISSHTSSISSLTTKTNANTTDIAKLTQAVAQHYASRVRIITGTYVGDGAEERHIEIGEEVSLIFIWRTDSNLISYPGTLSILPIKDIVTYTSYSSNRLKHTGSGFDIIRAPEFNATSESGEANYAYLAFVLDT